MERVLRIDDEFGILIETAPTGAIHVVPVEIVTETTDDEMRVIARNLARLREGQDVTYVPNQ